jgi:type II secretory pathway component GspD/PulD (secretin)
VPSGRRTSNGANIVGAATGSFASTKRSSPLRRFGPIPIIGDLLGTRSKEKTRTDLIFFLRPTVLSNPALDNAAALERVEKFPKAQREQIKGALSAGS